jgi:hypothetical protein
VLKVAGRGTRLKIAMLPQEFIADLGEGNTLFEELQSIFSAEIGAFEEKKLLEERLSGMGASDSGRKDVLERVKHLELLIEKVNIYALKGKVQKVMHEIGFLPQEAGMKVKYFRFV